MVDKGPAATPFAGADLLAAQLELDLHEIGICQACLSFVSLAIDEGDAEAIRRETNRMTPVLWAEGLARPAQRALERARRGGIPGVEAALADIAARGPRSTIAKAIVRRLATDLAAAAERERQRRRWRR